MSVLEEQCCPTQLHPLTLGPPTRHIQTCNKFVSIATRIYRQQDALCLRVRGWGVLVHPGNQAGWHGNNTGGVQLVLQESPALEGAAFELEIPNLEDENCIVGHNLSSLVPIIIDHSHCQYLIVCSTLQVTKHRRWEWPGNKLGFICREITRDY